MAIKYIVLFVETPRKFITANNKFTWCFHAQTKLYKFIHVPIFPSTTSTRIIHKLFLY